MQPMHGALFDTCAVSYWHGETAKFQPAIVKVLNYVKKEQMPLLISVVTVQELYSWVATQGTSAMNSMDEFIRNNFNILSYVENCARSAALYQAATSILPIKPKSAMTLAVDVWFRDAALAGTAITYQIPLIVTGDRKFAEKVGRYTRYSGRVEVIEEVTPVPDQAKAQSPTQTRDGAPRKPKADGETIHCTDGEHVPAGGQTKRAKDTSVPLA